MTFSDEDAIVDVDLFLADRLPNTSVQPSFRTCWDGMFGFVADKFVKLSARID